MFSNFISFSRILHLPALPPFFEETICTVGGKDGGGGGREGGRKKKRKCKSQACKYIKWR
jgi:hypothetical protein